MDIAKDGAGVVEVNMACVAAAVSFACRQSLRGHGENPVHRVRKLEAQDAAQAAAENVFGLSTPVAASSEVVTS